MVVLKYVLILETTLFPFSENKKKGKLLYSITWNVIPDTYRY